MDSRFVGGDLFPAAVMIMAVNAATGSFGLTVTMSSPSGIDSEAVANFPGISAAMPSTSTMRGGGCCKVYGCACPCWLWVAAGLGILCLFSVGLRGLLTLIRRVSEARGETVTQVESLWACWPECS